MALSQCVRVVSAVALAIVSPRGVDGSAVRIPPLRRRQPLAGPRLRPGARQRGQLDGQPTVNQTCRAPGTSRSSHHSSGRTRSAEVRASDDEAEEFGQERAERDNKDRRDGRAAADVARAYNDFWWDFGTRVAKQTSLVVDPPTAGCRPDAGRSRDSPRAARPGTTTPEERPLAERCILGFNAGPPMMPSAYNNNMQLVQTRTHVVILNEMVHSARIIDLTGARIARIDAVSDRRLARPLGRRHAGRRHDQLLDRRRFPRSSTATCTSSSASSLDDDRHAALRVHDRRSGDVDDDVDGVDPDDEEPTS